MVPKLITIFTVFTLSLTTYHAQQRAITDDGRDVLLKSDGTWEYYDQQEFSEDYQEFIGSNVLTYSDPDSLLVMKIHKIFIGDIVAEKGFMYRFQFENVHSLGKEIVFFDVSIENYKGPDIISINWLQFLLEDNEGYSYKSLMTSMNTRIEGKIHRSKLIRGGICFDIYKGNVPERIIFDPLVVIYRGSYDKKVTIIADGLSKLEIFTNVNHK